MTTRIKLNDLRMRYIFPQVSKRERDMVMKNSELSFRVRKLEDDISKLRTHKNELVGMLIIY